MHKRCAAVCTNVAIKFCLLLLLLTIVTITGASSVVTLLLSLKCRLAFTFSLVGTLAPYLRALQGLVFLALFNRKQDRMLTHQVITATAVTLFCLNGLWLLQSHRGWKRRTNLSVHVWSGHQAYGSSSNPSRGRTCFATLSDRSHTFTQHKELAVRSDREPSVHSCKNLQSMMNVLQSWTINQTVLLKWLFICWS